MNTATCLGALTPWTPSPAVIAAVQSAVGAPSPRESFADFQQFDSPTGCAGLCRVEDRDLHILAVMRRRPEPGAFRDFMREAKAEFAAIYIWEVWNPWLSAVLERYGFTPTRRTEPDGERVSGYVWRAPVLLVQSPHCTGYVTPLPKGGMQHG